MIDRSELEHYNRSMAAATEDKLWFLDHIPDRCLIVDFGCANGHLASAAQAFSGDHVWYGIENHPFQAQLARDREAMSVVAEAYAELRELVLRCPFPKVGLFSSVLHEAPEILPTEFAEDFDVICIRDMGVSEFQRDVPKHITERLQAHPNWDAFWQTKDHNFRMPYDHDVVSEFLLKYRYLDDHKSERFQREVAEAYPMVGPETLLSNDTHGFVITRFEAYSLPYLRQRWGRDFGFDWPHPTHFKAILEKTK